MIMAAGIGSRLRPVTDLLPKPMAPIVNRPALYHILRLLGRHGIREVVINLHHLPESIRDYLGTGDRLDMEVTYSFEEELLGTAGGVKSNEEFLGGETFLVMSGDALTDVDLTGRFSVLMAAALGVGATLGPVLYGEIKAAEGLAAANGMAMLFAGLGIGCTIWAVRNAPPVSRRITGADVGSDPAD